MKGYIKEIYGKKDLADSVFSEKGKLKLNELLKLREELLKKLSPEERKLLADFCDLNDDLLIICCADNFLNGFNVGIRMSKMASTEETMMPFNSSDYN